MTTEQIVLYFFGGLFPLALAAYVLGRRKAASVRANGVAMHSQPSQYGWYTLVWATLPALGVALIASLLQLSGVLAVPPTTVLAGALATAAVGLWAAVRAIRPQLRARDVTERVIRWLLLAASLISILTTLGIIVSILFESIHFFRLVSFWQFITGTEWSPDAAFIGGAGRAGEQVAEPKFGSIPLFAGTFMITAIAMAVAVPVGLLSAIYMSEYAPRSVRAAAKPMLEILAGIPTVVYGFFAAVTVAPLVVQAAAALGVDASYNNALAPGVVMGVMIIPFISSLSDDVINGLPQNLREGSYALGATKSETVKHILLPAALPGVISAFLLGVSRALGETMIVVMAAGLRPNLSWNPLEDMTTVTVRIVDALVGDQEFNSPETLSAFALGLVLFIVTLFLNLISTIMVRKFRQQYEA